MEKEKERERERKREKERKSKKLPRVIHYDMGGACKEL